MFIGDLVTSVRCCSLTFGVDQDLYPGQYNGPNMAVEALNTYLEGDRRTVRILDAAAGTGFVGKLVRTSSKT